MDEGSHTPTSFAIIPVHGVRLGDIPSVHGATKPVPILVFSIFLVPCCFIVVRNFPGF